MTDPAPMPPPEDFERDQHDLLAELHKIHEEIHALFMSWHGADVNSSQLIHEYHDDTCESIRMLQRMSVLTILLMCKQEDSHDELHRLMKGMN